MQSDPAQVDSLSVEQVLALCGDGKLTDNSVSSTDFRDYLLTAKTENLSKYVQSCLEAKVEKGGAILQDLINELGRRLDYGVENGLYQGKTNAIGFDGIWSAPNGHVIVVEVKTTDAYRINLDVIATYREKLMATGKVPANSSVLLVVGRQDTGDFEAQVRGSKHAWTFRIISADALIKLVVLKENADLASVAKIHELLVPFEYTKLDKIIEIAFTVAEETSTAAEQEPNLALTEEQADSNRGEPRKQHRTSTEFINEVRAAMITALSSLRTPLVKKSRALYWSADKSVRCAITVSKRYGDGGFWYAYHSSWDSFLAEGSPSFYALGCIGLGTAYALPYHWIHERLSRLNQTVRADDSHWHILLYPTEDGGMSMRLNDGTNESIERFAIPLAISTPRPQ